MRDGHIFKGDIELRGPLEQVCADAGRYGFTLCDQLRGVELGNYGFEDFVTDRGEDTLVVVETEGLGGERG